MRVINLIDALTRVNTGIWNAAMSTAEPLYNKFKVASELWFWGAPDFEINDLETKFTLKKMPDKLPDNYIEEFCLDKNNDIVVSHGMWRNPTKFGFALHSKGFKWVYTPHGMLEPWAMAHKKYKKKLYFAIKEKPMSQKATAIRAVGKPETVYLKKIYGTKVKLIHNGVFNNPEADNQHKNYNKIKVVFMGRLHSKKAILPMIDGWSKSKLSCHPRFELIIAGPDDGELNKMQTRLKQLNCSNIHHIGPVYGSQKHQLLLKAHFFILPSFSEGFPTSIPETMLYGMVPLISKNCNFPEAFDNNLAIEAPPNAGLLTKTFNSLLNINATDFGKLSDNSRRFVLNQLTIDKIAEQQFLLYQQLMS